MIEMTAARPLPKPRGGDVRSPRFEVVEAAVAAPGPAFLVVASRVRAERHPVGLEGRGKVSEDPGELTGRHVEQRGVREAPVEAGGWQVEREEVLMQHLAVRAASVRARPVHGRVSAIWTGQRSHLGGVPAERERRAEYHRHTCSHARRRALATRPAGCPSLSARPLSVHPRNPTPVGSPLYFPSGCFEDCRHDARSRRAPRFSRGGKAYRRTPAFRHGDRLR